MQYKYTVTLKPSDLYPKLLFALFACVVFLLAFSFVPFMLKLLLFLGMVLCFFRALRRNGLHGEIVQLVLSASENRIACIEADSRELWCLDEPSFPIVTPYLLMMRGLEKGRWRAIWFMRDSLPYDLPYQYNRMRAGHIAK